LRAILREPLVHFVALGALLFGLFEWRGGASGPGGSRIAVTPGLVHHLASGFARTWQRPPDERELKGLIDDYVKEEIATREALAAGLDRDDTIIRRRLRQKLEFIVQDAVDQAPPTDAELAAWLRAHAVSFTGESYISLRQVYLSPARRGERAGADAARLLARLQASGRDAAIEELGDSSMLPAELPLGPQGEVARVFGTEFARQVEAIEPGHWAGPVQSTYGLHLVLVRERAAPAVPPLAEIRPAVTRELMAERRQAQLEALYERLLQKYTVTIDRPAPETGRAADGGAR
jgi:hypothetical protein